MSDAVDAFDKAAHGYDEWHNTSKGEAGVLCREKAHRLTPPKVYGVDLEIGAGTNAFAKALTDARVIVAIKFAKHP